MTSLEYQLAQSLEQFSQGRASENVMGFISSMQQRPDIALILASIAVQPQGVSIMAANVAIIFLSKNILKYYDQATPEYKVGIRNTMLDLCLVRTLQSEACSALKKSLFTAATELANQTFPHEWNDLFTVLQVRLQEAAQGNDIPRINNVLTLQHRLLKCYRQCTQRDTNELLLLKSILPTVGPIVDILQVLQNRMCCSTALLVFKIIHDVSAVDIPDVIATEAGGRRLKLIFRVSFDMLSRASDVLEQPDGPLFLCVICRMIAMWQMLHREDFGEFFVNALSENERVMTGGEDRAQSEGQLRFAIAVFDVVRIASARMQQPHIAQLFSAALANLSTLARSVPTVFTGEWVSGLIREIIRLLTDLSQDAASLAEQPLDYVRIELEYRASTARGADVVSVRRAEQGLLEALCAAQNPFALQALAGLMTELTQQLTGAAQDANVSALCRAYTAAAYRGGTDFDGSIRMIDDRAVGMPVSVFVERVVLPYMAYVDQLYRSQPQQLSAAAQIALCDCLIFVADFRRFISQPLADSVLCSTATLLLTFSAHYVVSAVAASMLAALVSLQTDTRTGIDILQQPVAANTGQHLCSDDAAIQALQPIVTAVAQAFGSADVTVNQSPYALRALTSVLCRLTDQAVQAAPRRLEQPAGLSSALATCVTLCLQKLAVSTQLPPSAEFMHTLATALNEIALIYAFTRGTPTPQDAVWRPSARLAAADADMLQQGLAKATCNYKNDTEVVQGYALRVAAVLLVLTGRADDALLGFCLTPQNWLEPSLIPGMAVYLRAVMTARPDLVSDAFVRSALSCSSRGFSRERSGRDTCVMLQALLAVAPPQLLFMNKRMELLQNMIMRRWRQPVPPIVLALGLQMFALFRAVPPTEPYCGEAADLAARMATDVLQGLQDGVLYLPRTSVFTGSMAIASLLADASLPCSLVQSLNNHVPGCSALLSGLARLYSLNESSPYQDALHTRAVDFLLPLPHQWLFRTSADLAAYLANVLGLRDQGLRTRLVSAVEGTSEQLRTFVARLAAVSY